MIVIPQCVYLTKSSIITWSSEICVLLFCDHALSYRPTVFPRPPYALSLFMPSAHSNLNLAFFANLFRLFCTQKFILPFLHTEIFCCPIFLLQGRLLASTIFLLLIHFYVLRISLGSQQMQKDIMSIWGGASETFQKAYDHPKSSNFCNLWSTRQDHW